jgi:hypothetical protein
LGVFDKHTSLQFYLLCVECGTEEHTSLQDEFPSVEFYKWLQLGKLNFCSLILGKDGITRLDKHASLQYFSLIWSFKRLYLGKLQFCLQILDLGGIDKCASLQSYSIKVRPFKGFHLGMLLFCPQNWQTH